MFTQLLEVRVADSAIVRACLMGMDRLLGTLPAEAKKEALLWTMKLVMGREGDDVCDGLLRILVHHSETVVPQAEEVCRLVLKRYADTGKATRLALLQLLVKLQALDPASEVVTKMLAYTQELNSRDLDVDVRVQARNIRAVGTRGHLNAS